MPPSTIFIRNGEMELTEKYLTDRKVAMVRQLEQLVQQATMVEAAIRYTGELLEYLSSDPPEAEPSKPQEAVQMTEGELQQAIQDAKDK